MNIPAALSGEAHEAALHAASFPIVAMSGFGRQGARTKANGARFDAPLVTPFDRIRLSKRVASELNPTHLK